MTAIHSSFIERCQEAASQCTAAMWMAYLGDGRPLAEIAR